MEIGGQKLRVRIVCHKEHLPFPSQSISGTTRKSDEGAMGLSRQQRSSSGDSASVLRPA